MQDSASLTRRLARLIAAKPISAEDRHQAALFVLDLIANAIGGRNSEPGRIFGQWQRTAGTDAGREALLMGALAHTLEMDDLHRASVVHPGCVVIPAAWAVAKELGANGHALLDAVLAGFEVACRIGSTVGAAHYEVWHNTATCGPFGAAAAAGRLLRLNEDQMVDALGNAGTQSSGLWEFLAAGAMSKHLHAGRAAEAGLLAAQLASAGLTGPETILEGKKGFYRAFCPEPHPGSLLENPDGPWALSQTSMKPWPSCRHTHPAIDAAGDLKAQFDPKKVERIEVETYAAALAVCNRPEPMTDYDAKFSLQHCVAAALTLDTVDFAAFGADARQALAKVAGRVDLKVGERFEEAYPYTWGASISVFLDDDDHIHARRTFAKGDPQDPLTEEEVAAKAGMLMRHGGTADPAPLVDQILTLSDDGPLPDLTLFPALDLHDR